MAGITKAKRIERIEAAITQTLFDHGMNMTAIALAERMRPYGFDPLPTLTAFQNLQDEGRLVWHEDTAVFSLNI